MTMDLAVALVGTDDHGQQGHTRPVGAHEHNRRCRGHPTPGALHSLVPSCFPAPSAAHQRAAVRRVLVHPNTANHARQERAMTDCMYLAGRLWLLRRCPGLRKRQENPAGPPLTFTIAFFLHGCLPQRRLSLDRRHQRIFRLPTWPSHRNLQHLWIRCGPGGCP